MKPAIIEKLADTPFLYLTTIGRVSGRPHEIEIWFVLHGSCFYLLAETGEAAGWVKNIRRNPNVRVRVGDQQADGLARVLDRSADRRLWSEVTALAEQKYGWGDGLPVEITVTSAA
ncbi:MAG TPA: nitroreductase/quinone reductase family protein [Candidatus Binataceae bacterium]|nr:nitroreductase/quinone reductase family protein [Candidatus Binataceae bacterium]